MTRVARSQPKQVSDTHSSGSHLHVFCLAALLIPQVDVRVTESEGDKYLLLLLGELQQTAKELRETSAALTAKTSMCEQLSSSQARLERRVELLTKERDSLKQTLTLYQDEVPQPAAAGDSSRTCFPCACAVLPRSNDAMVSRLSDDAMSQQDTREAWSDKGPHCTHGQSRASI